jgi:hypothetical protein
VIVNWRTGPQTIPYPHFEAVQAVFTEALDHFGSLLAPENTNLAVNQCEVVYVNPILLGATGISLSEPQPAEEVMRHYRLKEVDEKNGGTTTIRNF